MNPINSISASVEHDNTILRTYMNDKGELDWEIVPSSVQNLPMHDDSGNKNEDETTEYASSQSKYHNLKLICAFGLFTTISMTIGIIVVCLTAPNHSKTECILTFKRTAKPVIAYDANPRHVAVGDFNSDGRPDLVIASSGTHTINIVLNDNNKDLSTPMKYSTGQGSIPYWVAVGQFNNDTALDIVVANYGINNVGIFLGYGNGTFTSQTTFSLNSSRPISLAVEDINNDTYMDIVVVNNGTFNVILLLGNGNGSFSFDSQYYMGYDSMPCSLAITDFNNDSRPDIVIVNHGTSDIAILLLNDNGTFIINRYSTGSGSQPSSVTVGDFNNDHYIDIAVANSGTKSIGVFIGNGTGTFNYLEPYLTGPQSNPKFILTAFITTDKINLDLIVANPNGDNLIVFEGDGTGYFAWKGYKSTGYNSNPSSIAALDFTNDTKTDIVVTNSQNNYVLLFASFGYSVAITQTIYSTGQGSYPNSVGVGDFNNDSWLDIVVANTYTNNIGVFIASSQGNFKEQTTYPIMWDDSQPYSVGVNDFNSDKYLDIAVATYWMGTVEIYLGQGNGSFEYYDTLWLSDNDFYPNVIAIDDINNDTYIDIVAVSCYNDGIMVLFGNGDATFQDGSIYYTEYYACPLHVSIGDFNSDSFLDLATANSGEATVSIFLNNGEGNFSQRTDVSLDYLYPDYLVIGDLNHDKHQDIVITSSYDSIVGILLGKGDGTFKDIYNYTTGNSAAPRSIVLGDFNRDNNIDITVANGETTNIVIFVGNGDGGFPSTYVIYLLGVYYPETMATGDFNNDGEIDIVVGNIGTNDISVLRGVYQADFKNQTYSNQGSGTHPVFLHNLYFKNNNLMDIIVVNSGNDSVQILFDYQNNGTFSRNTTYSTGRESHPTSLVIGDINRDNHPDAVIVDSYADRVLVLFLTNNNTILRSYEYSTGHRSLPSSVGLGDFNKDGWLDMAVANNNTGNIGVFLGYKYLTFTILIQNAPRPASTPYYVITGDFNNDSICDMIVAYQKTDTIGVYLGNGNGTFLPPLALSLDQQSEPSAMVVGDFDMDGYLDIVTANSRGKEINMLLGNGNGSFMKDWYYSTGSSEPVSIAVSDFNNDTNLDLVVANKEGDNIGIFMGFGDGSFGSQISYEMSNGTSPAWVIVNDFNNDHIPDIAVANYGKNNIGIYLGYGDGTFQNMTTYSTGNNSRPSSIDVGDFNKDHCMDIAVANQGQKNVGIMYGDCSGRFLTQVTYPTSTSSSLFSITVKDLNNDTILDIIVADWASGNGNIAVLYGQTNGTFLVPKIYSTGFNSNPTSVAMCDFNNDGQFDLAVTNSKTNVINIMLQNGSEPFGDQTTYSTGDGSHPFSINVTDIDNDDRLDILVANFETNIVGVFYGYGNGSFENQIPYSTGINSGPVSIVAADLNNDTCIDMIVTNFKSSHIGIFYGYGNRTFRSLKTYSTGSNAGASAVVLGDLDENNCTDIVATNYGTNNVLIFYGYCNETFREPLSIFLDYDDNPVAATIGYYNNDSLLDIAVANSGNGYVEVLLQTC